ncbi:MAG: transposase domain-containing protein [Candidatus Eremiobacteraeota bacterium]|nr:transposase domain-containing protein [Candidatus Eremiobacteraeota bacterium]MCW5868760.1 transposase domain-containing protein [Candidatus Eremiobacteraeota bacterium]
MKPPGVLQEGARKARQDKSLEACYDRKNWLFNFTETGARYSAVAYSLVQSCVLAGVDPTVYLTDVLRRLDTHPARDIHLLTPECGHSTLPRRL